VRIWSLHPKYLDARGLVALWREGLLAQAVLKGATKGYVHHPQLLRFREQIVPVGFIAEYLRAVHAEGVNRGYRFAAARIARARTPGRLTVTRGQLEFEWRHLMEKLRARDPGWYARLTIVKAPQAHPLFRVAPGGVAQWEKGAAPPNKPTGQLRGKRRAAPRRRQAARTH
jgi:Pyrimidine dimer DNA glycosylase